MSNETNFQRTCPECSRCPSCCYRSTHGTVEALLCSWCESTAERRQQARELARSQGLDRNLTDLEADLLMVLEDQLSGAGDDVGIVAYDLEELKQHQAATQRRIEKATELLRLSEFARTQARKLWELHIEELKRTK